MATGPAGTAGDTHAPGLGPVAGNLDRPGGGQAAPIGMGAQHGFGRDGTALSALMPITDLIAAATLTWRQRSSPRRQSGERSGGVLNQDHAERVIRQDPMRNIRDYGGNADSFRPGDRNNPVMLTACRVHAIGLACVQETSWLLKHVE